VRRDALVGEEIREALGAQSSAYGQLVARVSSMRFWLLGLSCASEASRGPFGRPAFSAVLIGD
jgi:hypothetical protein